MNDSCAAFHLPFGWETFASLAGDFEIGLFPIMGVVCHTASVAEGCGLNDRSTRRDEIADGQGNAVELLLSEAALPLSYCPVQWSRSDSNRLHAITHNFGPSNWERARKRLWNCPGVLSGPFHKYGHVRCAQFGLWQGAKRAHTPQWVCNRRATQPQAKFGATLRAAVLFRPDFVARSLQIHCGICSSLAPRPHEKLRAANV